MTTQIEKAILMICLKNPNLSGKMLQNIKDESYFSTSKNKSIYKAIRGLEERGEKSFLPVVADVTNQLVPSSYYESLSRSALGIPKKQQERFLFESIKKLKWEKKKQEILKIIHREIQNKSGDPQNVIDKVKELEVLGVVRENGEFIQANNEYHEWIKREETGIRLGIPTFDKRIDGFSKDELVIVVGRPTTGKTFVILHVVEHLMQKTPYTIGIFSLEMAKPVLTERMRQLYYNMSRFELKDKLLRGEIVDDGFLDLYQNLKIYSKNYSVSDMMKITEDEDLQIVFIDFLNLIKPESGLSRYEKTTNIIIDLKNMAKELGVLVVVTAQLSRLALDGSIPVTMDMIRDSGSIEESADFIIGLCRPEIKESAGEEWADIIRADLLKNKRGSGASIRLHKDRNTGKIRESMY